MTLSDTVRKANPAIGGAIKAPFFISVIGLAIQGLSVAVMYGQALTSASNGIPNDVSAWLSANVTPITPAALWYLVISITIGVFVVGLIGLFELRSNNTPRIRLGAALVLVSAVFAATTAWGFGIGSLLMLVGSIMGFKATSRVIQ